MNVAFSPADTGLTAEPFAAFAAGLIEHEFTAGRRRPFF